MSLRLLFPKLFSDSVPALQRKTFVSGCILHSSALSRCSLWLLLLVLLLGTFERSLMLSPPSLSFRYVKAMHGSVLSPSPLQAEEN